MKILDGIGWECRTHSLSEILVSNSGENMEIHPKRSVCRSVVKVETDGIIWECRTHSLSEILVSNSGENMEIHPNVAADTYRILLAHVNLLVLHRRRGRREKGTAATVGLFRSQHEPDVHRGLASRQRPRRIPRCHTRGNVNRRHITSDTKLPHT